MAWWTKFARLFVALMMMVLPVAQFAACSSGSTGVGINDAQADGVVPDGGLHDTGTHPDSGHPKADGGRDSGPKTLTSITVAPATQTIAVGTTATFQATANFSDGTTADVTTEATWTSSSATVASVNAGVAKGLAAGTATITATASGKSGTAQLTVNATTLKSLTIAPVNPTTEVGTTVAFTATGVFSDGSTQNVTTTATWTSGTTATATMVGATATAVAAGTSTITATLMGVTATTTLTVTAPKLVSVTVTPPNATTTVGGATVQYTATANYDNGTTANVTTMANWTSSATTIGTVGAATGLATAVAPGTTTISADFGNQTGTATLVVSSATIASIAITPATPTVAVGLTLQLTATATLTDGTQQNVTSAAMWQSATTADATVVGGLVTGVAAGSSVVTATVGSVTGTTTVTVTAATVKSIAVTPNPGLGNVGGTNVQFTATATLTDGTQSNVTTLAAWTSATATVGTVGAATGLATPVAQGSTTIKATYQGQSGTALFVVSNAVVTSIAVTPANGTVAAGLTQQMTATATLSDGTHQNVTTLVAWTSGTPANATINATGLATGVAAGPTTITATLAVGAGNVTGSTTLTVTNATIASITVSPNPASISLAGAPQQFDAVALLSDGTHQDVTATAAWTSGTPATATVSATGLATAVAVGNTVISAAQGGQTGTANLTVTNPALVSVTVTPPNPTIAAGTTEQFTATATFADNSTQIVTGAASWVSGTPATASVGTGAVSPGLAVGIAQGTSAITATFNGQTGTTNLTVTAGTVVSIAITCNGSAAPLSIANGTTATCNALATLSDTTTQDVTNTVTWNPGGPDVSFTGNVATGTALGTTQVTATLSGVTSNAVAVTVTPATLVSIAVTPAAGFSGTLYPAQQLQFTAEGTYSDGSQQNLTTTATWSSSGASATITPGPNGGLATGVSGGTVTITATFAGVPGTYSLTVSTATLVSIAVTAPNGATSDNIQVAQQVQFTATGTYSDGTTANITNSVSWTSANTSAFTVSATGLVTGVGSTVTGSEGYYYPQQFALTASQGAIQGVAQVGVSSSTIVALAITCTSPNFFDRNDLSCIPAGPGFSIGCTAEASYNDGSQGDVTTTVNWASGTPAVAAAGPAAEPQTFAILTAGSAAITASVAGACAGGICTSNTETTTGITTTLGTNYFCGGYPYGAAGGVAVLDQSGNCHGTLNVGQQETLNAVGLYNVPNTCPQYGGHETPFTISTLVPWSSAAPGTATVSSAAGSQGLVSAVAAGTTTIDVTFSGVTGTYGLTVGNACIQSLAIANAGSTYPADVSVPLSVTAIYSNSPTPVAIAAGTNGFSWNPSQGLVNATSWEFNTAGASGSTTLQITAPAAQSCGGVGASVTATVTIDASALPTSLVLSPANPTVQEGQVQSFAATATYAAYGSFNVAQQVQCGGACTHPWTFNPAPNFTATNDPASLNELVNNSLQAPGSTTVSFQYRNQTATTNLTVGAQSAITSIAVDTPLAGAPTTVAYSVSVPVGVQLTFPVTITYANGTTSNSLAGVTFASDTPTVLANPNANGVSTPTAVGTANVTASITDPTSGLVVTSTAFAVTVNAATISSLSFSSSPLDMSENTTTSLTVDGTYSNGQTFDVSTLVSSSTANAAIATVSTTAAGTTVSSEGTAANVTLTFTLGTASNTDSVHVSGACVTGIAVAPSTNPSVPAGGTTQFTATENLSDGSQNVVTGTAIWTTNAGASASIPGGLFSATNSATAGGYTVTASVSGGNVCAGGNPADTTVSATQPVTITAATVTGISAIYFLDGDTLPLVQDATNPANIPASQSRQLQIIGTFSDNTTNDITSSCSFASGNPAIASVSASGLVTGNANGSGIGINVTYTPAPTINGSINVNVANCGAPTVTVSPASPTVPVGYTQQFVATAVYGGAACASFSSDQASFLVTGTAAWASADTPANDATISSSGLLTGNAAGTANVTATYNGGTSNTAAVTITAETLTAVSIDTGASVPLGGTEQVSVGFTWNPACGECTANVSFFIADPTVLSINYNAALGEYILTGLKVGSTTFYAQSGTVQSSPPLTVSVTSACISAISLGTPSTTLPAGVPFQVTPSCTNSDGSACTSTAYSFATSAPVFPFGSGFVVEDPGMGSVTASISTANGACGAGVSSAPLVITGGTATLSSIAVSGPSPIQVGAQPPFVSEGTYTGGTGAGTYDISILTTLASSNPSVAQIAGPNGTEVLGVSIGSANITASLGSVISPIDTVSVIDTNPVLKTITVTSDASSTDLCEGPGRCGATSAEYPAGGFNLQLYALGTYADGTSADLTGQVTWTLGTWTGSAGTNPSVNANGLLTTGSGAGDEPITAVFGSVTSNVFDVTVDGAAISSVAIVSTTDNPCPGANCTTTVPNGSTVDYEAVATTSNGSYWVTGNFNWSSSAPAVGTIVQTGPGVGQYTAVAGSGTTNITATKGALTAGPLVVTDDAATPVTVTCSLVSDSTTPGSVTLSAPGDTVQLYVTVQFTDGSTVDETNSASTSWSTLHDDVSVAAGGLLTAHEPTDYYGGADIVTPTYAGVRATNGNSCTVTVN
jgi:uncharacterized protein YjdB